MIRAETYALRFARTTAALKAERRPKKQPEQNFQIKLVRDLTPLLPHDCLMTAFPAGGGGPIRGAYLKRMGLLAGMPDLIFIYRGKLHGLELKASKGRAFDRQIHMHERLGVCGSPVRIIKTLDQAVCALTDWGIPIRTKEKWVTRKGLAKA